MDVPVWGPTLGARLPTAVFTAAAGRMEILSLHSVIPEFCHITGIKTQAWFHDYVLDDSKEVQQNVVDQKAAAL